MIKRSLMGLALAGSIGMGVSSSAQAAWVLVQDADPTDLAWNYTYGNPPNSGTSDPTQDSQWVYDLITAGNQFPPASRQSIGNITSFGDGPTTVTGISAGGYLVIHDGSANFTGSVPANTSPGEWGESTSSTGNDRSYAFFCSSNCGDFKISDYFNKSNVSNYRYFSTVPLPGAVLLFGSALAGLGVIRRRKKLAASAA